MAWTTKSRLSQTEPSSAKAASSEAGWVTSQSIKRRRPQRLDQWHHPLPERVALIGEGELGAWLLSDWAMPQAIERSLATPMMRPRLPAMTPELFVIRRSLSIGRRSCPRLAAKNAPISIPSRIIL